VDGDVSAVYCRQTQSHFTGRSMISGRSNQPVPEKSGAEEPVRRKLSLHGPGKLTVSAVAAIDAGDIQIFSFADNTRGEKKRRNHQRLPALPHKERWKYSGLLHPSGFLSGLTGKASRLRFVEVFFSGKECDQNKNRITNALQKYMMWS
jgi:hypothetical protein